ncbi:MAG: ribbon-helix-helix protein, CopG family [Pseudomonadota bacterium]
MSPTTSSGSETRQRNNTVGVRLSDHEKDTITHKADRHRMSVSAFMREAALSDETSSSLPSPRMSLSEGEQIALVLACLGRLADLVTNFENDEYGSASSRLMLLAALRREIIAVRDQCFKALRRTP